MFERLTRWENNDKDVADLIEEKSDFDGLTETVNRLAEYEDSGLSPEEVQELAKAKADGRLVVLPCKGISLREAFKTMQSECGCPLSDMGIDERLGDCRKDCFDCVCGCLAAKEAAEKALGVGE